MMKLVKTLTILVAMACSASLMAGGIEIVKALYGAGDNMVDVTEAVKRQALNIPDMLFSITSSNNLAPKDPAPGKGKTLVLTYKQDGK